MRGRPAGGVIEYLVYLTVYTRGCQGYRVFVFVVHVWAGRQEGEVGGGCVVRVWALMGELGIWRCLRRELLGYTS